MANNSIVTIKYGETATKPVFQWDYGQTLVFDGFGEMLPDVGFEVHFANPADETSVTSIGTAEGVQIPDALLQTGLAVIVWVYLHDGATDGETEYRFQIPVARRTEPDNGDITPDQADLITQTMAVLQSAVDRAESAADSIEEYASAAAASAEAAQQHAATASAQALAAAQSASAAGTSADNAAADAAAASASETEAARSAADAAATAEQAQQMMEGYLSAFVTERLDGVIVSFTDGAESVPVAGFVFNEDDTVSIIYRAATALYIDKRLAALGG